jgi:hypothetical protein
MANKIKLGNRPKTFKEIEIPVTLPNGEEGLIPVTFKYMTKTEFGAWQDSMSAGINVSPSDEGFSWEKLYEQTGEKTADAVLGVIDSWGLDETLSKKSIQDVEAECGASALPAILRAFGEACREGKLGN